MEVSPAGLNADIQNQILKGERFMEMNREYASKGVAGAGLGTGIAGLSLGVLNSLGGLGALAGTWGRPDRRADC